MSLITLVLLPTVAVIGVAVLAIELMARSAKPAPIRVEAKPVKTRK